MQFRTLTCCTLILAVAPFAAQAAPLGAKPGAWEVTSTTTATGMPKMQVPEERLAQMTPEQRAQVENILKMQKGEPVTVTRKYCVKDSDTVDRLMEDPKRPGCKKKVNTQTASAVEVEMTCEPPHASHAKFRIETHGAENMTSVMDMQGEKGVKVHVESKGRWTGASCEGIPERNAPMPRK